MNIRFCLSSQKRQHEGCSIEQPHPPVSIIQHPSGHVTVVDVCNARKTDTQEVRIAKMLIEAGISGNYKQKEIPVNPITYLSEFGIDSIFRFIVTHPDMDHMDGIEDLFDVFEPINFWDADNECEKDFGEGGPYRESDWNFYKSLREGTPEADPKRLTLYAGQRGHYYNRDREDSGGGDGLHILAPTKELIDQANERDDYNEASYVILYRSAGGRVLLAGDSHDQTWEYILEKYEEDVKNVELLIAPHHGRKSERSYEFLDVVNPALTFFGNAASEHLAYGAWNYRDLRFITNNQANCMVVDTNSDPLLLYVTNKSYADEANPKTTFSDKYRAYYAGEIVR